MLFDRQETLSRVLEPTTAFVRFRYKAFLKWLFTIRNRMPLHFTIRNRVPYNKQLTNRACSGRTEEYWPSGQYSPVRPSRSVSKRLIWDQGSRAKKRVGSGITAPGIGISGVFHWIKDQVFWINKILRDKGSKFSSRLEPGIKTLVNITGSTMKKYTSLRPCHMHVTQPKTKFTVKCSEIQLAGNKTSRGMYP